ncbi:hypothetical protein AXK58_10760 [Tsukamurella tyrosinosolvens]|nr:hypothetical protein AXK58_10760 [Tsukamurella tyrosinosolvens]
MATNNGKPSPESTTRAQDAASIYVDRGWTSPLPLPQGRKATPPDDTTGNKPYPTREGLGALWADADERDNLALRMPVADIHGVPHEVIGVDVDHYDAKTGADTLRELVAKWGPLPDTYMSTSRDPATGSGIRFFLVPAGKKWVGKPGPDIEIIQRTHRYAVAWPSVVTWDKGPVEPPRVYQWYAPDGSPCDPPPVAALAVLPEEWQDGLRKGDAVAALDVVEFADDTAALEWLEATVHGFREPMTPVLDSVVRKLSDNVIGGAYDAMILAVHEIVRLGAEGHEGTGLALEQARRIYFEEVLGANDGEARRDTTTAEGEWHRSLTDDIEKLRAELDNGLRQLSPIGLDAQSFEVDPRVFLDHLQTIRARREDLMNTDTEGPSHVDGTVGASESDLAEIFADAYSDRLRWLTDTEQWAEYDDTAQAWTLGVPHPRVRALWHELRKSRTLTCLSGDGAVIPVPGSLATAKHVIESAQEKAALASSLRDFDNLPENEWPCANGILDTVTRSLRPYTAADLVTKRFAVDFVAGATAPSIEAWMSGAMAPRNDDGTPDLARGQQYARFVRRFHVASQVPAVCSTVQRSLAMHGPAGSGKGTFGLDLPRAVFGPVLVVEMQRGYFEKKSAAGKHRGNLAHYMEGAGLAVVDESLGHDAMVDTDFYKGFVGSAEMDVEPKGGKPRKAPRPLVTFMTNDDDLNFGKQDSGVRRRVVAVELPWGYDFRVSGGAGAADADTSGKFNALFASEGPGVLNLYLDALDEVRAGMQLATPDPLQIPAELAAATDELWSHSSFIGRALAHFRPLGPDEVDGPILSLAGIHAFVHDLAECDETGGARAVGVKNANQLRAQILAHFSRHSGVRIDDVRGKIPGGGRSVHTRVYGLTADEDTGARRIEADDEPTRISTDHLEQWRTDNPRKAKQKAQPSHKIFVPAVNPTEK